MATPYAVTGVVAIYPTGQPDPITVRNTGQYPVYLDSAPMPLGSTVGYPLGRNSSVVWDAGRPLHASSPQGTTLLISENGGNLFDAQAVAAEILAGGLADEIASAIAIGGAPPINRTDLLVNNVTVASGLNVPVVIGLDTNLYNSLILRFSSLFVGAGSIATPGYLKISGGPMAPIEAMVYQAEAYVTWITIPCSSASITILANLIGNGRVSVWGTTESYDYRHSVESTMMYAPNAPIVDFQDVTKNGWFVKVSNVNNKAGRIYTPSISGRGILTVRPSGAAGWAALLNIWDNNLYQVNAASGLSVSQDVIIPTAPTKLYVTGNTGCTGFEISYHANAPFPR